LARPAPVARRSDIKPLKTKLPFEEQVLLAKKHIVAGDVFQIVLSRGLEVETDAAPLSVYRALRAINPSPYLFYIETSGAVVMGSSPELLVRVEAGKVHVRPIAGTRKRGGTPEEDRALELELLEDEKERAEHLMLVDLGRNDVGQVARLGSVSVDELMAVERYSHVMHLVSHVSGDLDTSFDRFDALKAGFPAGTVAGAPKRRAVELIAELEGDARGLYAGAVGYVDLAAGSQPGGLDTCIAIRTLVQRGRRVLARAGAGIVYDSDPKAELEETENKAKALLAAVRLAEEGLRP
jgi:anthranilate synthase component 1